MYYLFIYLFIYEFVQLLIMQSFLQDTDSFFVQIQFVELNFFLLT